MASSYQQTPFVLIPPPSSSASQSVPPNASRSEPRIQRDARLPAASGARSGIRAPSVDEALPYSPLTSIVPFSPDILPFPSTARSSNINLFVTEEDRQRATKQLRLLNSEIKNPHHNSSLGEQSLRRVQGLLEPQSLAQYKFRRLPGCPPARAAIQTSNGVDRPKKPALSLFAQRVMESTDVAFLCPVPSPSKPPQKPTKPQKHRDGELPSNSDVRKTVNGTVTTANNHIDNRQQNLNARLDTKGPSPPKPLIGPAVVIESKPRSSQHQYVAYPVADEKVKKDVTPSKKRKRDSDVVVDLRIDQRERAEAALRHLNHVIHELLDAEERFQPGSDEFADIFHSNITAPDDKPVLTRNAQARLDLAFQKANSYLDSIELDDLIRIQKLCEPSVRAVETHSLAVGEDPSDDEVQEWVERLDLAEAGLLTARTVLRVLTAGREEKQLYSEDLLMNMLKALEYVITMAIIPVVESRSSGSTASAFKVYSANQKPLIAVLQACSKVLRWFGEVASKVEIAEEAITKLENVATSLIFVENSHSEKDACLGVQRFENLRRIGMDVLTKLFGRYPAQRPSIFNEILSSLEKLPVTRQSARQFKVPDGKPIQLVSALLMRLVQASATKPTGREKASSINAVNSENERSRNARDDSDVSSDAEQISLKKRTVTLQETDPEDMVAALRETSEPLYNSSWKAASYVIHHLVDRGLASTKSGDQPYRNLLDIFTEDFINVLGSPDWPAAQILLKALLMICLVLTDDEKQSVPAKNLALDLMGVMGSGISDLQIWARNAHRGIDPSHSEVAQRLEEYTSQLLDDGINDFDAVSIDGPYRIVIEYLQSLGVNDPQIQSARGCFLSLWAKVCLSIAESESSPPIPKKLLLSVRNMIEDPDWSRVTYDQQAILPTQGRLASVIIALSSEFGRSQARALNTIFRFMTSQQPTLRNRSLKSVQQLIEKDPGILDRTNVALKQVIVCSSDQSSLVRDSALQLLSKFLLLKPHLEKQAYQRIIQLSGDEAVQVRKRAMKILKDIYVRNDNEDIKTAIAAGLIIRVKDHEESVAELGRQIFDEIWMTQLYEGSIQDKVAQELALHKQAVLMVRTANESGVGMLETLLASMLSSEAKNAVANTKVCKAIVAAMFDAVIDNEDGPDKPSQLQLARTLTVFAKVKPKLFTAEQLNLLVAYIKNLKSSESLQMFVPVVSIYRHVFPTLSGSLGTEFLRTVQVDLLAPLSTLPKTVLPETAMCLWIIGELLGSQDKIVNLVTSVILALIARKEKDLLDPKNEKDAGAVRRYIQLAGAFGKACDFDPYADNIRTRVPSWKGASVSGLIIDSICNFTRQKQPQVVREVALESVAMICQAWPQNYLRMDVNKAFDLVFRNEDPKLKLIVLTGIRDFMAQEEKRSDSGADIKVGEGAVHGQERLANSFVPTDNDGATTTIAQQFLPHIVRIALSSDNELALVAVHIVASVNRQGLVHPKECGPPLIALETSPNKNIAEIAFEEHRRLHHKHESMFEKEYMKTVYQTYVYQRDVFKDVRGVIIKAGQPARPKLGPLFEVLRTGNAKLRKRFLTNLVGRVDFELPSLNAKGNPPDTVLFARFAMENLAVFEYAKVDELLALVTALEKMVVAGVGTNIAHAVDLDLLRVRFEEGSQQQQSIPNGHAPEQQASTAHQASGDRPVDPARLRQLTVASMIMLLAWETRTHLRQLWGLQKQGKNVAIPIKDLNKAPTKVPFVQTDKAVEKYLEKIGGIMTALETEESQLRLVKQFAELLSIDHELKLGENDDEFDVKGDAEGDDDGDVKTNATPTKGRKRKSSDGPATPSLKRRKSSVVTTPRKNGGNKNAKKKSRSRSRGGSPDSADDDRDGDWD